MLPACSRPLCCATLEAASPLHADRLTTPGIALTVGLQIGSGIFSSPGVVTLNTGSIGASLVVWLVSGILAWTGAR